MTGTGLRRAFVTFHLTLGVIVFIESAFAVFHSLHSPTESQLGAILPWFAGAEAIAAIMLLVPQTLKIGGIILLTIFIAVLVVHGPADGMPLFVYATGVIFVMMHGSAYSSSRSTSDRA